jgi:serralysin
VTPRGDFATELAIQADGKMVVVGGASWEKNPKFVLLRYNADGTLDTSFGGDGKVTTDFTRREDAAWGIAIQADGRIVAAGDAGLRTGNSRFAIARYNADGTLDSNFGGDGKVTTQFTRKDDPASSLVIQADGRIVVAGGASHNGTNPNFALARYNADGTLDTSFGGDGKVITDFGRRHDYANAIAVQTDGKLLAGGITRFSRTRGRSRFALVRYNVDGTLDTGFSSDGRVTTDFSGWHDSVQGLAVQADGKIVAGGIAASGGSNPKFALARYNQDGGLDATFGGDGRVTTDFTAGYDEAWEIELQPDGKIVAGGDTAGGGGRFAIARYEINGILDPTFSGDGKAVTNFTPYDDFANGLALQADGSIVLVGASGWGGSNPKVALTRYLAA